jgi:hypothetical protein
MMDTLKKYPIIYIAIAFISGLILQSLISGEGSVISGAIIQACWCVQGDDICLLVHYGYISLAILIFGIIFQIIFTCLRKNKKKKEPPKAFSVSYLRNKKKSFKEKQKEAIDIISKLINTAVETSIFFSRGISRQGEPALNEQCKNAYESGKAVMKYFKNENNRLYFSTVARRNITELYELISRCIHNMDIARSGNFNLKLWNEYSKKLKKIKIIKDEIDSEFREFLENFDRA